MTIRAWFDDDHPFGLTHCSFDRTIHTYLFVRVARPAGNSRYKQKLYEHIVSLRLRFFDKTPIGRLVTRTISDVETLADVFSEGLAAMVGDLLQIIFILAFMFYQDWRLVAC